MVDKSNFSYVDFLCKAAAEASFCPLPEELEGKIHPRTPSWTLSIWNASE